MFKSGTLSGSYSKRFFVGFEVLTVVIMNVAIFWDIALWSLYVNQCSTETLANIRTPQCYIPEDGNIDFVVIFNKLICDISSMF
jgi:hypothetical protein